MADPTFVHLHAHTDRSLLDGANGITQMVKRAQALAMPAVAVTDHGNMYAAYEFYETAKKHGVAPILGMEAYVAPSRRQEKQDKTRTGKGYYHLVLLARDLEGYKNLMKLSSLGWTEGLRLGNKPCLDREILERYNSGLFCLSACLAGEVAQAFEFGAKAPTVGVSEQGRLLARPRAGQPGPSADDLARGRAAAGEAEALAREAAAWHAEVFKGRYFLEVQAHDSERQAEHNAHILRLGAEMGIPVVATNDAHFLHAGDHAAHDTLICISTAKQRADTNRMRYDEGLYFKDAQEMAARFPDRPDVLERTVEIAEACKLVFEKKYYVPNFPIAPAARQALDAAIAASGGVDATLPASLRADASLQGEDRTQAAREVALIRQLARAGAERRYGTPLPQEVETRLAYELDVITKTGYSGYHLIVADFIQAARDRGILVGPGRGSAAGSLVCYSLGITDVCPLRYDLLFERFLNPERVSMPDIDVDFDDERRGEVIEYVREKYGRDAVAQIVTFGTMKARAAVKDVGRALGFSARQTDELAKLIPNAPGSAMTIAEAIEKVPEVARFYNAEPPLYGDSGQATYRELLDTARQLEGLSRHASTHAAGVVIAPGPVDHYVPVAVQKDKETGEEFRVAQYDMNCLEKAGMLKMDFLGLSTLTVIKETVASVRERLGVTVDVNAAPMDDEATYAMLRSGRTAGVFQFESALATDVLRQMRCDRFDDLVASNALLRPGPLDTGMHKVYIARKRGEEPVSYALPELQPILEPTQGVITYQEQVMRIAQTLAGISLAEADVLRKAVGKKDAELIKAELGKFKAKAIARGFDAAVIEELAGQIETFGRYGFNKSHSVAYSVVSYHTAYLKAHYPVDFMAALLSSVQDTKTDVTKYAGEARLMGLGVFVPDVNRSRLKFSVDTVDGVPGVRYGLSSIRNVGEGVVAAILAEREAGGPFRDFFEFVNRCAAEKGVLNKRVIESLIDAGAFDSLGAHRSQMLATAEQALAEAERLRLEVANGQISLFDAPVPSQQGSGGAMLTFPRMPELPSDEKLRREYDVLGVYVSAHPMGHVAEIAKVIATHDSTALTVDELPHIAEEPIRLCGMVQSVKEKVVKTGRSAGRRMASFTVLDMHGAVGVVCYADEWERFHERLVEGQIVVLEGGYRRKDIGAEQMPDFSLTNADRFEDVVQTNEIVVKIRMAKSRLQQDRSSMDRIRAILEAHQGNGEVIVDLVPDEGEPVESRRAQSRVLPNAQLIRELRDAVGSADVTIERRAPWTATTSGGRRGGGQGGRNGRR